MALRRASKWFREAVVAGKAATEIGYLHDAILDLRKFFRGFEASDGYSLKSGNIARMPVARYQKIRRMAAELHAEQASPHVVVRPRSPESIKALYSHTRSIKATGRKAFVVHVAVPAKTKIKIIDAAIAKAKKAPGKKAPAKKKKAVSVVRQAGQLEITETYYYFTDYAARAPVTMEQVIEIAERMIKKMPAGFYVFVSSLHHYIGTPMEKSMLIGAIESDWLGYDDSPSRGSRDSRGLAQTLIGFKRIATTGDAADKEYDRRLESRRLRSIERTRLRMKRIRARRGRYG